MKPQCPSACPQIPAVVSSPPFKGQQQPPMGSLSGLHPVPGSHAGGTFSGRQEVSHSPAHLKPGTCGPFLGKRPDSMATLHANHALQLSQCEAQRQKGAAGLHQGCECWPGGPAGNTSVSKGEAALLELPIWCLLALSSPS